jgi:hypothetical protein
VQSGKLSKPKPDDIQFFDRLRMIGKLQFDPGACYKWSTVIKLSPLQMYICSYIEKHTVSRGREDNYPEEVEGKFGYIKKWDVFG